MHDLARHELLGPHPQYGWDFPEEIPENFRKDPGNALRAFPGISLESTAGRPQALQFKAFEASRAFPEFSPPQYGWGRLFFQNWFRRGPFRAGHGIPSSTGGISDFYVLLLGATSQTDSESIIACMVVSWMCNSQADRLNPAAFSWQGVLQGQVVLWLTNQFIITV